ncbi:MAG: hypothetical protein JRI68_15695 [Deltaproteobacteria bacterium]|nr:hypothetical protein [Deltaproteobacteria bacterium]
MTVLLLVEVCVPSLRHQPRWMASLTIWVGWQSASLLGVQPEGQQLSPPVHWVMGSF